MPRCQRSWGQTDNKRIIYTGMEKNKLRCLVTKLMYSKQSYQMQFMIERFLNIELNSNTYLVSLS